MTQVTTINLAIVEVFGLTPLLLIVDRVIKGCQVELAGIEGNAGQDCMAKFIGDAASCRRAFEISQEVGAAIGARFTASLRLGFAESTSVPMVYTAQEFSQITCGYLHILPKDHDGKGWLMKAIGLLETQGLSAAINGADAMLKAADVEIVGKEKIGAAHVTIMIRGDVAAVKAAIDAGKASAEKVGKVVAAEVIARPHDGLIKLLPQ